MSTISRIASISMFLMAFLVCSFSFISPGQNHYQQMLTQDLKFIKETLEENHPGMFDESNPDFRSWLNEGFEQASALRNRVNSKAAYIAALRLYLNGFKDAHVRLNIPIDDTKQWYNNFSFYYDGNCYRVAASPENAIPADTKLVTINTLPAKEFIKLNLLVFQGNSDLAASFYQAAHSLHCWYDNPLAQRPEIFGFDIGNAISTYDIVWHEQKNFEALTNAQQPFSLIEVSPNTIWVRLPTFAPSDDQCAVLKSLISSLSNYRNHDIVFDVRGNGGGCGLWSSLIIQSLCGQDHYKKCVRDYQIDWRASRENINFMQNSFSLLKNQFSNNSEIMNRFERIISGSTAALESGQSYYCELPISNSPAHDNKSPLIYNGKIFVIIDEWCASACLIFIDELKQCIDKLYLIGHPTSADSLYLDARTAPLASSQAELAFPMPKIFREHIRGNNIPYNPDIFVCRMNDTTQLQEYFLNNKSIIIESKSKPLSPMINC